MKAKQILEWIVSESVSGEDLGFVDVPDENDAFTPQNEEWWLNFCGGLPPKAIPAGHYLYYYREQYDEITDEHGNIMEPDAEVELSGNNGYFSPMYLYLIED